MVKRTIIFALIVVSWAFIAAVAARSATRDVVAFTGFAPGTIVVKTNERQLYYVLEPGRAMRFPVGVGRAGKTWTGKAVIEGKYVAPAWSPPDDIKREHPDLPEVIPGGAEDNPMGAAALTMRGGITPSTAPIAPPRSAASSPTAASACSTGTSARSIAWSMSARR